MQDISGKNQSCHKTILRREGDEKSGGVDDGTRTHDNRNHNPGLYQLSYVHHLETWPARRDSNSQPPA